MDDRVNIGSARVLPEEFVQRMRQSVDQALRQVMESVNVASIGRSR